MKLSVLDQSPIISGHGAAQAIEETVKLARRADALGYLDSTLPDNHPFKKVRVQPEGKTAPELWLLGSSDYSGLLAAPLGVRFSFAHFINAQGGDLVMRAYKDRYQSSGREPQPHTLLCCFVICATSDEEAERRARGNRRSGNMQGKTAGSRRKILRRRADGADDYGRLRNAPGILRTARESLRTARRRRQIRMTARY